MIFFYQHLPPYLITEHVLLNTFVMLKGYFVLLLLLTLFIYCFRDCSQILLLMLNEFEQTISIYAPWNHPKIFFLPMLLKGLEVN